MDRVAEALGIDPVRLRERNALRPGDAMATGQVLGEEDGLTPPAEAATMAAAIPRARLDVIAGAGHLSGLEDPVAVNAALRAFLAR